MGDIRTTSGDTIPLTKQESKSRFWRCLLWGALGVIVFSVLGSICKVPRRTTAKGYVTTVDYAEIRPPVTGIVSKILVTTGDVVQEGQLLVQLDNEQELASLAEATARYNRLKTEMDRRKSEMDIDIQRRSIDLAEQKRLHQDAIRVAELQLRNATTKRKLTQDLVEKGLKAAMNLEDEKLREELAQVELASLKQKDLDIYAELLKRDQETYRRELAAMQDELAAMQDAVKRAEAQVHTREIKAPIAGKVVRYEFVVGELLQPSSVIYEIFGGDNWC